MPGHHFRRQAGKTHEQSEGQSEKSDTLRFFPGCGIIIKTKGDVGMKTLFVILLCLFLSGCATKEPPAAVPGTVPVVTTQPETLPPATVPPEPSDDTLVPVLSYIPTIQVELKYATEDNFTGKVIYDFDQACLRYGTVKKLAKAQAFFQSQGLSLKIWDAYRPVSAQWRLWEACPDPTYVANPNRTYSSHSRGNTIDVSLVDKEGRELEMPTAFDDFSPLADRDYSDCSLITAENARLLQSVLEQNGFSGYQGEWWHFSDTDSYPVEES